MATAIETSQRPPAGRGTHVGLGERSVTPVKAWALLGCGFLLIETYTLARWVMSGQAVPTTIGRSTIPRWMSTGITLQQILYVSLAVTALAVFVVRPWRRERRLSRDGMFAIAFLTIFWQDPLTCIIQPWFTYNTGFVNFGSWAGHIPGSVYPHMNRFSEPILATGTLYVGMVFPFVVLANAIMRKAKARWPQLGKLALMALIFPMLATTDLVLELIWLRTGFYSYTGVIRKLTIWPGHYYQFPIYEALLFGVIWTAWASLRHFRDDKGETFAERGIEQVRATSRQRQGLRLLALIGACNAIFFIYNIPMLAISLHVDRWNADIQRRPYFTNGLCGPGTTYACPGPGVPIYRPGSMHVTPDGQLIVPAGAELPDRP